MKRTSGLVLLAAALSVSLLACAGPATTAPGADTAAARPQTPGATLTPGPDAQMAVAAALTGVAGGGNATTVSAAQVTLSAATAEAGATAAAVPRATREAGPSCTQRVRPKVKAGDNSDLVPGARLGGCDLSGLHLSGLDLTGADLSMASLRDTDLHDAVLTGANLTGASLANANLLNAKVTQEQLDSTLLLLGATLPDGSEAPPRRNLIPAGEFQMGCDQSDAGESCSAAELPPHTVYLDAFRIDQTEVTNAQYRLCVEAGACSEPSCWDQSHYNADDQPVVCVDWSQAQGYCAWTGARLPTEAEWEKAARGTGGRVYPWGDEEPDCTLANYEFCVGTSSPVGSYPAGASPYGVLDMAGNVWEWVGDWYGDDYYSASPASNPQGPDSGSYRVLRGGSWHDPLRHVRAASRVFPIFPDSRSTTTYFGFRCVAPPGE